MKKLLSILLSTVILVSSVGSISAVAYAKENSAITVSQPVLAKSKKAKWGTIKHIKAKCHRVDEPEVLVTFDKIKGVKGYQIYYDYYSRGKIYKGSKKEAFTVKTTKNKFFWYYPKAVDTLHIRAFKYNKKGKRVYGPWKTVKFWKNFPDVSNKKWKSMKKGAYKKN